MVHHLDCRSTFINRFFSPRHYTDQKVQLEAQWREIEQQIDVMKPQFHAHKRNLERLGVGFFCRLLAFYSTSHFNFIGPREAPLG